MGGGAGKVNLAAGAGLVLVSSLTAAAWAARRRRLRAGGPVPAGPVPGRAVAAWPARGPRPRPLPSSAARRPVRPARPRPGAGLLLGCDELLRLAGRDDAPWLAARG